MQVLIFICALSLFDCSAMVYVDIDTFYIILHWDWMVFASDVQSSVRYLLSGVRYPELMCKKQLCTEHPV